MIRKTLFAVFFSFTLLNVSAFAANFEPSPWTEQEAYRDKVTHKLGFAALNVITGWTALLFETSKSSNFLVGLTKGTLRGLSNTLGGAVHAVTFPIPVDVPLPGGGVKFEQ